MQSILLDGVIDKDMASKLNIELRTLEGKVDVYLDSGGGMCYYSNVISNILLDNSERINKIYLGENIYSAAFDIVLNLYGYIPMQAVYQTTFMVHKGFSEFSKMGIFKRLFLNKHDRLAYKACDKRLKEENSNYISKLIDFDIPSWIITGVLNGQDCFFTLEDLNKSRIKISKLF